MSESKLQAKILKLLAKNSIYAFKVITANKAGIHDIIGCSKGTFFTIEVKWGTGRPSALQLAHKQLVEKAGGHSVIIWTYQEAIDFIDFLNSLPSRSVNSLVSN